MVPDKWSQLLRLTVRPSLAGIDDERVVVWSGSRREVWEEGKTVLNFHSTQHFMGMTILSPSGELASASLDPAFVATTSPRYFLAVRLSKLSFSIQSFSLLNKGT